MPWIDRIPPRVFDAVLALAAERGAVHVEKGLASHPAAGASAAATEAEVAAAVSALLEEQGLAPAAPEALARETGADPGVVRRALGALESQGGAVRVARDLFFAASAVDVARSRMTVYLAEHGTILASDARDLLGTSRKYVVPLLEYFDAQGLTKREGDVRTLRRG